MVWI
jgi:hypothetical protein